jgi:hypothetical protein
LRTLPTVNKLVLYNCKVAITENFSVDPRIDYQINELDLRLTLMSKSIEKRLNKSNIDTFFKALSKTNLKDNLEYIHIYFDENERNYLEKVRLQNGFTNTIFTNFFLYGGAF